MVAGKDIRRRLHSFSTSLKGERIMSFVSGNANQATQSPSLLADSAALQHLLVDIHSRIVKLGDILHGPEPRQGEPDAAPEQIPTVRRNIDNASRMLTRIQDE